MIFWNDYDVFEVGETCYLIKDEEIYGNNGLLYNFKKGDEVEIVSLSKKKGYGLAEVVIEGIETSLSLDELYYIVFD